MFKEFSHYDPKWKFMTIILKRAVLKFPFLHFAINIQFLSAGCMMLTTCILDHSNTRICCCTLCQWTYIHIFQTTSQRNIYFNKNGAIETDVPRFLKSFYNTNINSTQTRCFGTIITDLLCWLKEFIDLLHVKKFRKI